ncbi:MAG: chromosome segregation protein SMC [Acidithiobacillus sp.]
MRLSAIILQGFKSFRENTRIPLNANPVVIVGPNGCGKSNTVDALRWVLGESSARQLRGGSLSDVISNGSSRRPPASQATVELRFDNSDGTAPGAFAEVAEISVKRSLDRKGDGHYRINGARCRRRDVGDLFLGTGLGSSTYAIVEQGTIGRIIEARPDDLRSILEEAGGISRYKERRRETAQRMLETREHLQRLHDIHGEMEGQWQRLQRQALAAQKLRALRVEERQWQWWSVQQRLEVLRVDEREILAQQEQLLQEVQVLEQNMAQTLQTIERLRDEEKHNQESLTQAQAEFYDAQAHHRETEHHLREQQSVLQRLQDQYAQQHQQQQKIQMDQSRLVELENQRLARIQELEARRTRLAEEEKKTRQSRQEAEQTLEKQDQERQQEQQKLADMRRQRDVATAQIRELEPRLHDLERRIQQLMQPIASERSTLEQAEKQSQMAEQTLQAASVALQQIRESLTDAHHAAQTLRQPRDMAHGLVQELAAQHKALESLLQRLEKPLPKNQAGQPTLVNAIQVRPGWERALEEVLGSRLHARILKNTDLHERSTALWESSEKPEILPEDALLLTLTLPENLEQAVQDWLWGLRIAPDLESALRQRSDLQAGEAWITPQGAVVYRTGLVFPEQENGASLLQCRRELEENRHALTSAQEAAKAAQTALDRAEQQGRSLQAALREAEQEEQKYSRQAAQSREALVRLRSRVEAEDRQRAERQAEHQRLDTEQTGLQQRLKTLREDFAEGEQHWRALETQVREAQLRAEEHKRQVAAWRAAYGRLREERQGLEIQGQKLQTESEATRVRLEDLRSQDQHIAGMLAAGQEEQRILQERLPQWQAAQTSALNRKQAQQEILQALQEAAEPISAQIRQQEAQRHSLEDRLRSLQKSIASADQQMAGLQVRLEEYQLRATTLAQDLPDDPGPCPDVAACAQEIARIETAISRLGNVNLAAEEELEELEGRRGDLLLQVEDVESALASLEEAMQAMDQETTSRFRETFDQVNLALQDLFAILFGGGQAALSLVGDDLLDAGLVLRAQPPGKRNAGLQQLSGGEKALTAIALVFALFRLNPAPFCVLDEVDAPLDDANVGRFCHLVKEMAAQTQFLIVTHRSLTMQIAEQLVGVTMTEPGISRIVPVAVAETLAEAALLESAAGGDDSLPSIV